MLTIFEGARERLIDILNYAVLSVTDQAADLVRQLMAFSRQQALEIVPLDVSALIPSLQRILQTLLQKSIELRIVGPKSKLYALADRTQLQQVLINLTANARDACGTHGLIRITADEIEVEAKIARQHEVQPGRFVRLTISDDGCGMDEQTKAHLFEPFFSTKEVGKGTGLGLATTYGIVRQHGGFIEVESELGRGTQFQVYFPTGAPRQK